MVIRIDLMVGWAIVFGLSVPLTSFWRRECADCFSLGWQISLRILPLGLINF